MRNLLCRFVLLSALAVPVSVHAATFNFSASGGALGFNGTGVLQASANGNGSFTITGISGTGVTSLVGINGFNGNDNLLFPSATSLVDTHGFAFRAGQGNTLFTVDIFSPSAGAYDAYILDSDNVSGTVPLTFTLSSGTVPEPSSLLLMATGLLGLAGLAAARRRPAAETC